MKLIVYTLDDFMKSINSVKLSDAEYWSLKKKMVELECLTWRDLLLKLLAIADHKVERGVEDKERPLVVPALDVAEEGEVEKPRETLEKEIRPRGRVLRIRRDRVFKIRRE